MTFKKLKFKSGKAFINYNAQINQAEFPNGKPLNLYKLV